MSFEEMKEIMIDRGFYLHNHSADYTVGTFIYPLVKGGEPSGLSVGARVHVDQNMIEIYTIVGWDLHLSTDKFAFDHKDFENILNRFIQAYYKLNEE